MDYTVVTNLAREGLVQLCLFLATLLLLYKVVKVTFSKLPPGPIGIPFLGYLPFLGKKPQFKILELSKRYGNLMSLQLGNHLNVVCNDYETMKEVLSHPMALGRAGEIFDFVEQGGFTSKNGVEWEEQRRFCIHSMRDLGLGRQQWEKMIQEEVPDFLKELSSFGGKPVEINERLALALRSNILSLLIGRRLEKGVNDEEIQLASRFSDLTVQTAQSISLASSIPGLRQALIILKIGDHLRNDEIFKKFSKMIIKPSIKNHQTNEQLSGVKDFINLYLDKIEKKKKENVKHFFSEQNLEGNINTLFLGASDTVLASLGWLFRLMAGYPDVQKKVQIELDEVIGQDGTVSYEDRLKVPYTLSVLMETQRFSSIVPLSPPRRALDDFEVRGYTIPKGATIFANLAAIHHDSRHWKDPENFNPNRFFSEDGQKLLLNLPSFVPFSIGKRNCPGETVAWMEILIFFTSVMQKFAIQTPIGVAPNYEYTFGIVNHLKPQELCFIERTV